MPISNLWLINDELPETNNLSGLNLTVATQTPDQLTFTQTAAYDADPVYNYLDTLTLKRDGTRFFEGQVTDIRRTGTGSTESIQYTVSGPWWQLQQIIVEQVFTRGIKDPDATDRSDINDTPVTLARIILGTDANGQRLHSGETITEFINYALTELGAAALFQLGTVGIDTEFPFEELSSITVAEGITRVLRWNPDVVAYFDYTASPPTLKFQRRSALLPKTYRIDDVIITDNSINPRNDLQKDGVLVKYERVSVFDGQEYTEILEDSAGDISDPFKTLILYYNLQGTFVSLLKQPVTVDTIQKDSASYWKRHLPHLNDATSISLSNTTQTPVDDTADDPANLNDGTSLAQELTSGSIAEWMSKQTCDQIIKGDLTYTLNGQTVTEEGAAFKVVGTDAKSLVYTYVDTFTAGEAEPSGFAASILASIGTLTYEGALSLKDQDIPAAPIINKTLNIQGGRTEWQTMNAQVYRVSYQLDSGQTQIAFGPAKHLGPDDLYQLYRNTRTLKPSGGFARSGAAAPQARLPTRSPKTVSSGSSGGGSALPFTARYNADTGEMSISGGSYSVLNTETTVSALAATTGIYAYIRIKHSSSGVLDTFTLQVSATEPNPTELDSGSTFVEYTNCKLAYYDEFASALNQPRSGNVALISTIINNKTCLWPYFHGGSA